jgi:peptidylprolyl isomerase
MRYSIFAMLVFFIFTLSLQGEETKFMTPKNPIVTIETNMGNITIALKPDAAPKAVENFLQLANKGYYNDVIFHRVIKGFMIQGGDPTGTGRGGESVYGKPFEDEVTPSLTFTKPGILAMANAGPRTNGSQFFITTAATPWLNNKHTIFGEVVEGYSVVQKIENTAVNGQDKPLTPVKILKITLSDASNSSKTEHSNQSAQ